MLLLSLGIWVEGRERGGIQYLMPLRGIEPL